MRVAHFVNDIDDAGNGIINVAIDLAIEQARAGNDVYVISRGGDFEGLLRENGVKPIVVDTRRRFYCVLQTVLKVRRLLRREEVQIFHAHVMSGIVVALLARIGSSLKLVATVHNEYQRSSILMGLADRVVAVSDAVGRSMEKKGVPSRRITVVRNGTWGTARRVELSHRDFEQIPSQSIVSVGAVCRRKGSDVLIDAFESIAQEYPDCHLFFVGNPDDKDIIAKARFSVSADRIHFVGFSREPSAYVGSASVFALASRADPYPLALLEARECGVPIVASAVDGIPEALDGGRYGVLVPPDDSASLARAIEGVLSGRTDVQNMIDRSNEDLATLSTQRMAGDYLAVYASVTS